MLIKCRGTGCFCSINCDSIVWTGPTVHWQTIALSPIRSKVDFWIWSYLSWEDAGLRDHSPHKFKAAQPDGQENCLVSSLPFLQARSVKWRDMTSAFQEGHPVACWASRDAQEHSYLYSVGGKAQPTGSRSSRNNKHFIAPCLSGHCGGGRGHIWVSILWRPFYAASAGSDWEKKIHKDCLGESKTSVPDLSMIIPPPSPLLLSSDKLDPCLAVALVRTKHKPTVCFPETTSL